LRSVLSEMKPTVVISHGGEPLKYLVPALLGRDCSLVYYAIGTYAGTRRRGQLRLWKSLVKSADVVAAVGTQVRAELHQLFGIPIGGVTVTSNGRDPDVFRPSSNPMASDPPIITFVGALTTQKRPDRFVEVIAELRRREFELRSMIVGDGPLRDALVDRSDAVGVELLGSRDDMPDLFRRTDVLVFPSCPTGEGMPGVLIEAGLSGVPAVATDVPGVRSIIVDTETGLVVVEDDFEALVEATARLLREPELRRRLGQAARRHCVEQFSLSASADRWVELLNPLIDARAP
jgi:glycosyltransferase involved in cell wall biosynthesis